MKTTNEITKTIVSEAGDIIKGTEMTYEEAKEIYMEAWNANL